MRNQRGFTLLEIMIALVILGIALIPMAGMYTTAHFSLKQGSEATEALGLAQQIMEEQKAKYLQKSQIETVPRIISPVRSDCQYAVEVTEESSKVTRIKVTVYYQVKGQERTLSLVTRMGDWKT